MRVLSLLALLCFVALISESSACRKKVKVKTISYPGGYPAAGYPGAGYPDPYGGGYGGYNGYPQPAVVTKYKYKKPFFGLFGR